MYTAPMPVGSLAPYLSLILPEHGPPATSPSATALVEAVSAWFVGLGYGARLLSPWLARPRAWQVLDVLIGPTMLAIAVSLALSA